MDTLHAHLCHLQFLNTEDIWSAGPIHRCSIRELYQTEYIHPLFSRTSQSLQNHQAKKHKKEWVSGHAIIETQQQKRKGSLGRYVVSKYTVLFAYAETKIRRIWSFFFLLFCSLFFFFQIQNWIHSKRHACMQSGSGSLIQELHCPSIRGKTVGRLPPESSAQREFSQSPQFRHRRSWR